MWARASDTYWRSQLSKVDATEQRVRQAEDPPCFERPKLCLTSASDNAQLLKAGFAETLDAFGVASH